MAKYRTLEPVTYVANGKVVSAPAERTVELADAQAEALAGKIVAITEVDSMFPDGAPLISPVFVRETSVPATEPVNPPAPAPAPVKAVPKAPAKPESK